MADDLATLKSQLENVQTAIKAVLLTGQSYNRTGFGLQRASYKELKQSEKDLKASINRAEGNGVSVPEFRQGASSNNDGWNS